MAKPESQITSKQARYILAGCEQCAKCAGRGCAICGDSGWTGKPWGVTRVSALKTAAGVKTKYFFASDLRDYLIKNPGFSEAEIYKRKKA